MDQVKDNVKYIDESNFCINTDAKVTQAAKQMLEKNLSALIVVAGGENWGVITETDISRKIVADELNPKETKVKFIMAKPIISIESNMSMMSAFLLMGSHKIRHVAVTEDTRRSPASVTVPPPNRSSLQWTVPVRSSTARRLGLYSWRP